MFSLLTRCPAQAVAGTTSSIFYASLEEEPTYLRPPTPCPRDVAVLTRGLLRDLPHYANRVAYRSAVRPIETSIPITVLLAGRAEFAPLNVSVLAFSDETTEASLETIQQLFFTTLERQYLEAGYTDLEHYHWLFLTEAEDGWRLTLMFSRIAVDESINQPPTPPRESSDGIIGQAVKLWLRDCRAGAVYPVESSGDLTEP